MAKSQSAKGTAKPTVVVGIDFGTTYSGFAFAHVSAPNKIYTSYDYPMSAGEKPYCKTLTACYYKPLVATANRWLWLRSMGPYPKVSWKLQSWGYPARADYERDVRELHMHQNLQEPLIPSGGSMEPSNGSSSGEEKVPSIFKHFSSWDTSPPGARDDNLAPLIPKALSVGGGILSSWPRLFGSQDTSQHGASDGDAPPPPQPSVGVFLSRFKLHLASRCLTEASSATPLPPGLTIAQVITDYLRELGRLILKHLQNSYGAHFSSEMVQWCITVPSIWDNSAKATMRACMVAAGLVSAYRTVTIVLEPMAASFHCRRVMGKAVLEAGHKLLVADIGGETSDIVVQEVVKPGGRVKEVTMSSGGLCGGTYVDSRFMEFLKGKVGQACVSECHVKHRDVYGQLMKEWEHTKSIFDRSQGVTFMNLPNKLALEWERFDVESGHPGSREYGELEMSSKEMQSIFDPVVQQNVDLIQRQIVEAGGKVRVMAMVGGFSESPYLLRRMIEAFGATAEIITCPPNPGSAICQGAVALILNPNTVVSRVCKRTYGCCANKLYEKGIDPIGSSFTTKDGTQWCRNRFHVMVKKGDAVVMDRAVTRLWKPSSKGCRSVTFFLFSCDDELPPRYTTDKRLKKEGKLVMDVSRDMKLEERRSIELSLCFGACGLEVKARAVNFNAEQVQFPVKVDYLLY